MLLPKRLLRWIQIYIFIYFFIYFCVSLCGRQRLRSLQQACIKQMWTIFKKSVNHLRLPEQKCAGNNQKYYKTVCTFTFFSFATTGPLPKTKSVVYLLSLKSCCRSRLLGCGQLRCFWFVKPRHKQTSWKCFLQRCVSCERSHRVQSWNFKLQYLFNSPRYILRHSGILPYLLRLCRSLLNIPGAVITVSSAWYAAFRQKARFHSQAPLISHWALVSFLFFFFNPIPPPSKWILLL